MGIVARSRRIRGPITLTTRLDPDKGVFQGVTGVGSRPDAEASAFHVAPVAPSLLLGGLDAIAACKNKSVIDLTQISGYRPSLGINV